MKFAHTADWQLGSRFTQFGSNSEPLREARFKTLERTLKLASEKDAEFFLVAGDLFEDNQVHESIVTRALDLFGSFPGMKIFLLPGNHDPYTGPGCVWNRPSMQSAPSNIHIFKESECVELSNGFLIASPIKQKKSTTDPSLILEKLTKELPEDAIKIGITHGSIAIPSLHQENDFPIHPEAATRAGLHYLAVGHWHGWNTFDEGKIIMPGTPEPDRFDQDKSGSIAMIDIDSQGTIQCQQEQVATLRWVSQEIIFDENDDSESLIKRHSKQLPSEKDQCVIRWILQGRLSPSKAMEMEQLATQLLASYPFSQVQNLIQPALTEAELNEIRSQSPLLAQILNDLEMMESYITGNKDSVLSSELSSLNLGEFSQICGQANLDQNSITTEELKRARQLIFQNLNKATS